MKLSEVVTVVNPYIHLKVISSRTGKVLLHNALSSDNLKKFADLELSRLSAELYLDDQKQFASVRLVCYAREFQYYALKNGDEI